MPDAVIIPPVGERSVGFEVGGETLAIHEWAGSAPSELHVHHRDDIAWVVLEGSLHFRFAGREIDAPAGTTLFIPAGTPHTYGEGADSRYLVIAPPRLFAMFGELIAARKARPNPAETTDDDRATYRRYDSELLE
jgi:quercetin dioxygenase-like cupin family protein